MYNYPLIFHSKQQEHTLGNNCKKKLALSILLTENEEGPHSSSSLIESIDEYWGDLVVSVCSEESIIIGSSSSSVASLPVATLKPKYK